MSNLILDISAGKMPCRWIGAYASVYGRISDQLSFEAEGPRRQVCAELSGKPCGNIHRWTHERTGFAVVFRQEDMFRVFTHDCFSVAAKNGKLYATRAKVARSAKDASKLKPHAEYREVFVSANRQVVAVLIKNNRCTEREISEICAWAKVRSIPVIGANCLGNEVLGYTHETEPIKVEPVEGYSVSVPLRYTTKPIVTMGKFPLWFAFVSSLYQGSEDLGKETLVERDAYFIQKRMRSFKDIFRKIFKQKFTGEVYFSRVPKRRYVCK